MDWQKQMEQMVGSWTEMQRNMWDNWVDSVRKFGQVPTQPDNLREEYERQLAAWEASVQQALDTQKDWAARWSSQVPGAEQAPEPVARWMEQMQGMMQGWTNSQHELWTAWFESLRTMDPGQTAGRWEEESRTVLEAWQQAADRAQEALGNWTAMAKQAGINVPSAAAPAPSPATSASTSKSKAPAPAPGRPVSRPATPARKTATKAAPGKSKAPGSRKTSGRKPPASKKSTAGGPSASTTGTGKASAAKAAGTGASGGESTSAGKTTTKPAAPAPESKPGDATKKDD